MPSDPPAQAPAIRSAIVVGAGVAGLACAGALARAGLAVSVLDKGRRPGGRMATRRLDGVSFNHGAQFVAAQGKEFAALLAGLEAEGRAMAWPQAGGALRSAGGDGRRMVFVPGMSALPAAMAAQAAAFGATLGGQRHAGFLHRNGPGWVVRHFPAGEMQPGEVAERGGEVAARHDAVLLAIPPEQAAALLTAAEHPFAGAVRQAVIAPCWAAMLRFAAPVGGADVLRPERGPIAWAAREGARPGRSDEAAGEAWTVHATPEWSQARLEWDPHTAAAALAAGLRELTGAPAPDLVHGHRWRYALVEKPLDTPCLWDSAARLGLCGDWCLGARAEAAYDSGLSLARAVLAEA